MRDFLTIGLEYLTGGRSELAAQMLRNNYIQTIFKTGFDQLARLREEADRLAHVRGFQVSMLDETDQQFLEALRRFKPLVIEEARLRNFQSIADVERAHARLDQLVRMVEVFLTTFPRVRESLRKTFNTATMQFAVSGRLEPVPLTIQELTEFLAAGFKLPKMDVPEAIAPFAEQWWGELREELEPLAGKTIDRRFIAAVFVQ
jgi:hypothetical protein